MNKLYIIEGIWHSGKSTFIKKIEDATKIIFIAEPIHKIKIKSQHDIDLWYIKTYIRILKNVTKTPKNQNNIFFLERSIFSSLGFIKTYSKSDINIKKYYRIYKNILEKAHIRNWGKIRIILLSPHNIKTILNHVKKHEYLKKYKHETNIEEYYKILNSMIKKIGKCKYIKTYQDPSIKTILKDILV